jgi:cardiolipin synthase
LSLADLLSLARIPLGVAFVPLAGRPIPAFVVLALAAATDVLDGWTARHIGKPSRWGDWLDPVCDKLFMTGVVTGLYVFHHPPLLLLGLILTREAILFLLFFAYHAAPNLRGTRYDYRANAVGKANTVAQFLAVTALLLHHPAALPLAALCGALGVASSVTYARRGLRRPAAKGQK